jgi:hypothetical protein
MLWRLSPCPGLPVARLCPDVHEHTQFLAGFFPGVPGKNDRMIICRMQCPCFFGNIHAVSLRGRVGKGDAPAKSAGNCKCGTVELGDRIDRIGGPGDSSQRVGSHDVRGYGGYSVHGSISVLVKIAQLYEPTLMFEMKKAGAAYRCDISATRLSL